MPKTALSIHERWQVVADEYERTFTALADTDQNLTTLQNVLSVRLNQVIGSKQLVDVDSIQVYNASVEKLSELRTKATSIEKLNNAYETVLNDVLGIPETVAPVNDDKQGQPPPADDSNKDGATPEHGKSDKADESLSAGEKRVLEKIVASKQYKKLGGPERLLALITSTSLASRWFTSIELCRHVMVIDPQFFTKNNDIFFALNGATSSQTKFFDKKPATKEDIKELKSPRAQYLYRMNDAGKLHVKKFWAKYLRGTKK